MIVPNYVPEPLEVPGNVADEPYPLRVAFIRRVTLMHLGSIAAVALASWLPWPPVDLQELLLALFAVLIGLDLWRIWKRGQRIEAQISAALLPIPLGLCAWSAREATLSGFPVFSLTAGLACAGVYTALCGRDYSFVGCATLSLICSTVALAAFAVDSGYSPLRAAFTLGTNAAYLVYFAYDLASLMSRRRRGEEAAAITDLYRDVFNFFGYAVRLVRHWRKHRIWV